MWAGGRVTTLAPLRPDRPATRRTTLRGQSQKQGRSGPLTFVTVAQDIYQDGQHVIAEEQDILYRPAENRITPVASGEGLSEAPVLRLVTDPVLLFRFSALTYNGHRIHYDRDYARDREGYAGLLVHGPLQALMMAEAARELSGRDAPARFEYRLVAPLFDGRGLNAFADADADGFTTAIQDDSGRTTATGRFVPA
jgi:3-methylfumaryl-CoA hydratase